MKDSNVSYLADSVSPTSSSLLQLARDNNRDAWERIAELYTPLMLIWCRRVGLPEADSLDVCQDVLRAVFAGLKDFRKYSAAYSFRQWLRTLTRNKAIDYLRKSANRPVALGGSNAQDMIENVVSPEEDFESEDTEKKFLLRQAMEMVRIDFEPRTWDAFWKMAVEGQTAGEIAIDLGISSNAVYLAKARVLKRLSDQFVDLVDAWE